MTYTATITTTGLRLRESRIVADLLLAGVDEVGWRAAILDRNVLQLGSPVSIRRVSRLLRVRLEPLGPGLWSLVRDGSRDRATQAVFAGAVAESRLLADFLDITVRDQRARFADRLEAGTWRGYIAGCRARDPEMPEWSDTTLKRLRSAVFSMLAEVGYLQDTRSLALRNVFVDDQLAAWLRDLGQERVLRCMGVSE